MAFPVYMTFSKTINNCELAPNLTDLLEGLSIGAYRAISRQSAQRLFTPAFVSQIPQNVGVLCADPKDKTKGGSYAYHIRTTY